jgi:hypothetical protein
MSKVKSNSVEAGIVYRRITILFLGAVLVMTAIMIFPQVGLRQEFVTLITKN